MIFSANFSSRIFTISRARVNGSSIHLFFGLILPETESFQGFVNRTHGCQDAFNQFEPVNTVNTEFLICFL
jgi:hypothetical protein